MKKIAALPALALAAAALVACGGSGSTTTTETGGGEAGGGGSALTFEVDPTGQLAYTSKEVSTKPGKVTIDLVNGQPLPHDVAIEDSSGKLIGKTEVITEGTDSTVVDLKPGTYTFYCTVPGHRQAGMEGTLKVE